MARDQSVETQKLIILSGNLGVATFEGGIQRLHVIADADCYIDFDEPAVTTRSFLIKANAAYNPFDFGFGNVQKVYAITTGGSANIYLVGIRGNSS